MSGEYNKKEDYPSLGLLRVSSTGQGEVQHGSLEQQRHAIIKKVQETSQRTGRNYYIINFIEVEVSAKFQNTKNRKELPIIDEYIKSKTARALFADRSDRLSRDLEYNVRFARMMMEYDAEYHEVENGKIDFNQQDQFFGFVYRSFNAEAYSVNLSKTVRTQGRRSRVNNGKDSSTAPVFGIDAHPTLSCQYVINLTEASQLNELGWHLVKTKDAALTAKYGNEMGIRTKKRCTKERIDKYGVRVPSREVGGELLTGKKLLRMLTSPKVWGKGRFKDDLNQFPEMQNTKGYVEFNYAHGSVLDEELKIELSKLLEQNKKHSPLYNDDFLLSGFLFSEDDQLYCGDSSLKYKDCGNTRYRYYCAKSVHKDIKRINASHLEDQTLQWLKELLRNSVQFKKILESGKIEQNKLIQMIDENVATVEAKIFSHRDSLAKFSLKIRELVMADIDNFQDALKILNSEKVSLEKLLEASLTELKALKLKRSEICDKVDDGLFQKKFQMFFTAFDQLENCDKKTLLKALIPKMIIHRDLRIELKMNPVFYNDLIEDCHESGKNLPLVKKWRERRDSNPRPSA